MYLALPPLHLFIYVDSYVDSNIVVFVPMLWNIYVGYSEDWNMALLALDHTLLKIMYRTGGTTLAGGSHSLLRDGGVRLFWKKSEKVRDGVDEKLVEKNKQLEERQRQLQARGLPKKRPIPGNF